MVLDSFRSTVARSLLHLACVLTWILGASTAALAQTSTADTLQRIKARGYINLGHRESSVPFSFVDDKGQVVGYSHELALRVVGAIRQYLGDPLLVLRLVPISPENRIAAVSSGEVDLECGSTTHNSIRARQVGFSNTIFVIGTRMLTARDSGIHDFADLAGKRVVTTVATTSEYLLRRMNREQHMNMEIITAPDYAESFAVLENGGAEAFMMDDALLYGELAKARDPAKWVVTGTPQSFEAYGCMMKRGDAAFKRLVDNTLAQVMTSGEAERIYHKWFMSPLPPNGLNLNYPLSDTLKALFQAPNDHPYQ
jgi:glutamate/aspartate transport system substrate-binding protein